MRKFLSILATAAVAAGFAVGLGGTQVVHASCNTSWTDHANNYQWGPAIGSPAHFKWQVGVDIGYQMSNNGSGGCYINYRQLQILYVWNGSSYVVDSNDSNFNGNYVSTRIWKCSSLYAQAGPVLVGGYGSSASGSTGWFYSGNIDYGSCGPQIDDGPQSNISGVTFASYASDSGLDNGLGGANGTYTYFGYAPYVSF